MYNKYVGICMYYLVCTPKLKELPLFSITTCKKQLNSHHQQQKVCPK